MLAGNQLQVNNLYPILLVFMPILSDQMDLPSSSNVDYISATYPAVMQAPLFINPMTSKQPITHFGRASPGRYSNRRSGT